MDSPIIIVSICMVKFIRIQRVNLIYADLFLWWYLDMDTSITMKELFIVPHTLKDEPSYLATGKFHRVLEISYNGHDKWGDQKI